MAALWIKALTVAEAGKGVLAEAGSAFRPGAG